MDFVSYFKQLYSGEGVLRKHLLLFAVAGIMALLLNNVASSYTNTLLSDSITIAPMSVQEIIIDFAFGGILWLHIFGYEYKFLSNIMNDKPITLPEFDSEVFITFCRMLPMFFVWQLYFVFVFYMTLSYTISSKSLLYYFLIGSLMLFVTPFVFMIYVKFSKDFKYSTEILEPWHIAKYIDKGLVDVVIWSVKFASYALIPAAFMVGYMDWAINITLPIPRLVAYLIGLCAGSYIFIIFKLIYGIGMANIVKEKIS